MNIKKLNLQDLESFFNLTSKIREGMLMMARANNNMNTPSLIKINTTYNMLHNEVMRRIEKLENNDTVEKEVLHD